MSRKALHVLSRLTETGEALPVSPAEASLKPGFALALQQWYLSNHRSLPWRKTQDPYAIWVSEIMLQQTQVASVIPYYQRFLERFPTVQTLAQAPLDAVLKAWEGLGYYSRGRNLHAAAQQMVAQHQGRFPNTLAEAEALPGVGKSTAGAILTFGYGQKHPLLDGNVKRVLARLFDVDTPVADSATTKTLWQYSANLLAESEDSYTYNQAIMELGATLCTPRHPQCLVCPVKTWCQSAAAGTQHQRPVKVAKPPTPHVPIGAAVIWHRGKILIQQRPAKGLLGGLWEFPGGKQEPGETLEQTVHRELMEELGIQVTLGDRIAQVKHAYSHFKITLHAYSATLVSGTPKPHCADALAWVKPEELRQFAYPKANLKVIEAIEARLSLPANPNN
ncbi:MAG: A/G-specific adenine glycosylase [Vampirovibrionales bacterium]